MIFKLVRVTDTVTDIWFYCPGCYCNHKFTIGGPDGWNFDGNNVEPSICTALLGKVKCTVFIKNRRLIYTQNCKHHLAGCVRDMEPVK